MTSLSNRYDSGPAVALLHGAGYVGGELIRLLAGHPDVDLSVVTSRTFAEEPIHTAHPRLKGQVDLDFTVPNGVDFSTVDAVVVAAEHGQSRRVIPALRDAGFEGSVVDLSRDFRFADPAAYTRPPLDDGTHPAPELLAEAVYGLPELNAPYATGTRLVANPGCYATGITLALAPLAEQGLSFAASVTALTGASGSGATPSATTHFPDRDGNVRAYKVLAHQHTPEISQSLGDHVQIDFVPASGPWTRGIWGTAHVSWPETIDATTVEQWYQAAYAEAPFVRCTPGQLPELRWAAHTPFCDVGWQVQSQTLVVGFAIDNLLKGAASQAVQNLNLLLGLPETVGLLPTTSVMSDA